MILVDYTAFKVPFKVLFMPFHLWGETVNVVFRWCWRGKATRRLHGGRNLVFCNLASGG